jgi:hypothetical protein
MSEDVDPRALGKDTTGEVSSARSLGVTHSRRNRIDTGVHRPSSKWADFAIRKHTTGAKRGHRDESRIEDGENDTEVRDFSAD